MKKGMTLVELLVGMTISLILVAAIGQFLGRVAYGFQDQKAVYNDRSDLQRSISLLEKDLWHAGIGQENGVIWVGTAASFTQYPVASIKIDTDKPANMQAVLSFHVDSSSVDVLATNVDNDESTQKQPLYLGNATLVTYQVETFSDPVDTSNSSYYVLTRKSGEDPSVPIILGMKTFTVEYGQDADNDGTIDDDEWYDDNSITNQLTEKAVRITIETESKNSEGGQNVTTRLQKIVDLRNIWQGRANEGAGMSGDPSDGVKGP